MKRSDGGRKGGGVVDGVKELLVGGRKPEGYSEGGGANSYSEETGLIDHVKACCDRVILRLVLETGLGGRVKVSFDLVLRLLLETGLVGRVNA